MQALSRLSLSPPDVRMNIKKVSLILNSFIHDFASGYWLSAVIVVQLLDRFRFQSPDVGDILRHIQVFFFWNTVGAVIVVLATGAGRMMNYETNLLSEEVEPVRRRLLTIKHIVLLLIYGAGQWW